MPRKKAKSRMYFTQLTENAIIRYNKTDDTRLKNIIYNDHIDYPFDKLVENIIHTFKFYYFDVPIEQVKHEVVSFLVLNMHKFQEGKGKAFSYFSIVAKNYLILHNNSNYKKMKSHDDIDSLYDTGVIDKNIEQSVSTDIFEKTISYFDKELENLFLKENDRKIAESILYLCKNKDSIDNFNKKAIYIMIREMTDVKTSKITQISNVFRKIYPKLQEEVLKYGHIENFNLSGSL